MYNFSEIEKKWQQYWEKNSTFKTHNPVSESDFKKPKYYCLDMFPYPSGAGLHVGHPEGFTANDIIARYKKTKGYNVLHPMGWDAFGLPAENYAIKTGTHPRITTDQNITNFKKQIKSLGFSYDWEREVDTTDPKYYQWTQWIFLKLFENGLAYEQDLPINYCPSCKTGLANEEVLNDFSCERCGTKVEKKQIRQWVLAITKYAERLLNDVDKLDWPEGIKDMQRNWIGKSEGCEFEMKVVTENPPIPNPFTPQGGIETHQGEKGENTGKISVYTTRIDTVFGMTYAVIAPDHKDVFSFITPEQKSACEKYIQQASQSSDQERTGENKEKTGVFTGSYLTNPFNGEKVPLWIADYVLGNYGTGAVMAVPAHDERDFAFAKKYNLEMRTVVAENNLTPTLSLEGEGEKHSYSPLLQRRGAGGEVLSKDQAFTEDGILVNSQKFDGFESKEARKQLTALAEKNGFGTKKVNYKLRDWLFSRQRYWGEPIPLIHLKNEDVAQLKVINDLNLAREENKAYILNFSHYLNDDDDGKEEFLVINQKIYSKLYNGLYGKIVCDYNLPLELPNVANFAPAGDGNSPLVKVEEFVNVTLADNLNGKRETNTMPQWGGSCWYYLRFMDKHNSEALVERKLADYWGQVDSYVGGAEHAVLHLLYARFWHKFLFDIGIVSDDEPFFRLRNQGLILAFSYQNSVGKLIANDLVEERDEKFYDKETGEELSKVIAKMSKSLKNVVNPDDIIAQYGSDALRLYEMYMADFKDAAPWDTKNIAGVKRFLEKAERIFSSEGKLSTQDDTFTMKLIHKSIKKIEEDIENYKFNTAIAQLMILINNGLPHDATALATWKHTFIILLHPFAPHLAEELWERIGEKQSVFFALWPTYDAKMVVDDTMTIGVQVDGKVRGEVEIGRDEAKESVLQKAKNNPNVAKWIEGKEIVKEIYVPGKIVNVIVR